MLGRGGRGGGSCPAIMKRHRRGAHRRGGNDSLRDPFHGRLQAGDGSGVGTDAVLRGQGNAVDLPLRLSFADSHVGDLAGQLFKTGADLRVPFDCCLIDLDRNGVGIFFCLKFCNLRLQAVRIGLSCGVAAVPAEEASKNAAAVGVSVEQS